MTATPHAVKIGSRYAAVIEYCHHGGSGCRSGFWCPDRAGGWGVAAGSAERAASEAVRPHLFRSRRAAIAAAEEMA